MRLTFRQKLFPSLAGVTLLVAAVLGATSAEADDSPLKAWMKSNMGAQKASGDFPGLVKAFDKMAAWVPDPAFAEWAAISKQGSVASKAQDKDGVKAACNDCHKKYKDAYKAKHASKAPPN